MEKAMKIFKIIAIISAIVFFISFQNGFAEDTVPVFDVSSDGSVIPVEGTEAVGERIVYPLPGAEEVTAEMLAAEGVDVTPLTEDEIAEIEALPAVTSGIEGELTEVVIGYDSRQRVYPNQSSINARPGLLTFSAGRCSAWLISRNTVATAGHCVARGNGTWYSGWRFYASHSTGRGSCTASGAVTNSTWFNTGNEQYDYAVVKLNCTIGNTVGTFGYTTSNPFGHPIVVPGYPGDKSSSQQWVGYDKVRTTTTRQIFYAADTASGMSGSPVVKNDTSSIGPFSIGIHAYGRHGGSPHGTYNHGTRITSGVFDFFQRND